MGSWGDYRRAQNLTRGNMRLPPLRGALRDALTGYRFEMRCGTIRCRTIVVMVMSLAVTLLGLAILRALQSFGKLDYSRVCNGGPITIELAPEYQDQIVERHICALGATTPVNMKETI